MIREEKSPKILSIKVNLVQIFSPYLSYISGQFIDRHGPENFNT